MTSGFIVLGYPGDPCFACLCGPVFVGPCLSSFIFHHLLLRTPIIMVHIRKLRCVSMLKLSVKAKDQKKSTVYSV